ncbi:MAG: MerR family DNA-binding protein, partial [Acidimicrobiales bacterium]
MAGSARVSVDGNGEAKAPDEHRRPCIELEIRGVIGFRDQGTPPCSHVLELIEGRAADLDRRIAELAQLR